MSIIAFVMIVLSAVLHASWNLIAKKSTMSIAFYTVICTTACLSWVHTQFWTPVPIWDMPLRFWCYLAGSVLSDALLYCIGLKLAYRTMEMSTAYPMMRSLPLLLTAMLTAILGWGKELTWLEITGMTIVFAGCLMMPLARFSDFNVRNYFNLKILFVLLVASGTTGYTIFDNQAQAVLRECVSGISKPVLSMSFYSTRGIFLSSTLLLMTMCIKDERKNLFSFIKEINFRPVAAGCCASITYILVLMAMNYVTNVSYVQAFRQVGLVLGVLGGILLLGEKFTPPKIAGVLMITGGLVITVI